MIVNPVIIYFVNYYLIWHDGVNNGQYFQLYRVIWWGNSARAIFICALRARDKKAVASPLDRWPWLLKRTVDEYEPSNSASSASLTLQIRTQSSVSSVLLAAASGVFSGPLARDLANPRVVQSCTGREKRGCHGAVRLRRDFCRLMAIIMSPRRHNYHRKFFSRHVLTYFLSPTACTPLTTRTGGGIGKCSILLQTLLVAKLFWRSIRCICSRLRSIKQSCGHNSKLC